MRDSLVTPSSVFAECRENSLSAKKATKSRDDTDARPSGTKFVGEEASSQVSFLGLFFFIPGSLLAISRNHSGILLKKDSRKMESLTWTSNARVVLEPGGWKSLWVNSVAPTGSPEKKVAKASYASRTGQRADEGLDGVSVRRMRHTGIS